MKMKLNKNRHHYQPYRRAIQATVLLLMIAIPFLNLLKIDVVQG